MELLQTQDFQRWLTGLRDFRARSRVLARIERLRSGNPGDIQPVRGGLSELRIPYGPGYRVYLKRRGQTLVILLAGGDKSSQSRDIERAIALTHGLEPTKN